MEHQYETPMQACLRMLAQRAYYYQKKAEEDGEHWRDYLNRGAAYESAVCMLRYALDENWGCLEQFDYFDEIKPEEYNMKILTAVD